MEGCQSEVLWFHNSASKFLLKTGAQAPFVEDLAGNECRIGHQGCVARPENELLADPWKIRHRQLPKAARAQELPLPREEAPGTSRAPRAAGVERLPLRAQKWMLVSIDIVLADEPLGLETARDLFRKQ